MDTETVTTPRTEVVKEPYVHPITYILIAAAAAVLAVSLARRRC